MNARTLGFVSFLPLLSLAAACASTAPPELVNARTAYDKASKGPAAQFAPADLHSAEETLKVAEHSFDSNGDSDETKDLAYAASRKSELADARGRTSSALKQRDQAVAQLQADREQQVKLTSAELARTKDQLNAEKQAREDAERRAQQAAADLARIASVKQEPRGMVITLSGGVLFTSGKSDLLPQAQSKLSQVADSLGKQDRESKIRVEGYTDSTGAQTFNMTLSQARADAVRSYLVSHGIAGDRITAEGFGPSKPVADNTSAEGRADNRRVEIVVENGHGSSSGTNSMQQ